MKTSVAKSVGARSSKQKGADAVVDLRGLSDRSIAWHSTGDINYPWKARVGDRTYTIRLNDFPAQPMYTLLTGRREIRDFDEWPPRWSRTASLSSVGADRRSAQPSSPSAIETYVIETAGRVTRRGSRQEVVLLLQSLLQELSARDREVLTSYYTSEESSAKIFADLSITEGQFRLLMSRVRKRFAELAEKALQPDFAVPHENVKANRGAVHLSNFDAGRLYQVLKESPPHQSTR